MGSEQCKVSISTSKALRCLSEPVLSNRHPGGTSSVIDKLKESLNILNLYTQRFF